MTMLVAQPDQPGFDSDEDDGLAFIRRKIDAEVYEAVKRMAKENPSWGAPKIHGELLKLGIEVAQSTVVGPGRARRGRRSCAIMLPVSMPWTFLWCRPSTFGCCLYW